MLLEFAMNRLAFLTTAFLVTAVATPVRAADLPPAPAYKAPVLAPAYNWTGFYIGANVGGGFANIDGSGSVLGIPLGTSTTKLNGVIGGGQIGYNWQYTNWVFGLEADFQGSSQRSTTTTVGLISTTETDSLPWFGTVRGRVGFTPSDRWLVYATGGLAYGELESNGNVAGGGLVFPFSTNSTKAGWAVGGGVEAALWGNWTGKIEYLYIDINNFNLNVTAFAIPLNVNLHLHENIARVGLNYRF
jgi:outer membrane immunogenic protein